MAKSITRITKRDLVIQKGKAGRNEVKITLKSAEIIGALMLLQKAKKRNEGK